MRTEPHRRCRNLMCRTCIYPFRGAPSHRISFAASNGDSPRAGTAPSWSGMPSTRAAYDVPGYVSSLSASGTCSKRSGARVGGSSGRRKQNGLREHSRRPARSPAWAGEIIKAAGRLRGERLRLLFLALLDPLPLTAQQDAAVGFGIVTGRFAAARNGTAAPTTAFLYPKCDASHGSSLFLRASCPVHSCLSLCMDPSTW